MPSVRHLQKHNSDKALYDDEPVLLEESDVPEGHVNTHAHRRKHNAQPHTMEVGNPLWRR